MSPCARVLHPARLGVIALLVCGCAQRQLGGAEDDADEVASTGASEPAENRPPVARVDTLFTRQNEPLQVPPSAILGNDGDPEDNPLFATILRPDTLGRVGVEDGTITYTPPEDFWGVDRFAYEIDDGRGGLATADVLVYVAPTRVELETIVSDERGFEVEWQSLSELLGVAGDFNGDGVDDLLFRPNDQPGPETVTHVVLLAADGGVKGRVEILSDLYITTTRAAGDFNGDGLDDLAFGGCCTEETNLHVVFGKTDTDPVDVRVSGEHSIAVSGPGYHFFGMLSSGDIDGDGLPDVVAGANGEERVFVVYGVREEEDILLSDLEEGDPRGFLLDYHGRSHAVGDVNADGYDDLLVSRTVVLGGAYEGTVSDLDQQDRSFDVIPPNGGWPEVVDAVGDFNGDGFGDLVFGRTDADPMGVWIVFGKGDTKKVELDDLEQGAPVGVAIQGDGYEGLGAQLAGVGDFNGDGRGDVLVSALRVGSGPNRARAWLVYGNDDRSTIDPDALAESGGGIVVEYPEPTVDRHQPFVGGGDFNGDGVPDIVLGSDGLQDWSVKVVFGVPTQDTCCIVHDGPGCTNPEVTACVCENLPGCCEDAWSDSCVIEVTHGCGQCPA